MGSTFSIAFVCVQNAGRSQIATAFAKQEREKRGLDIEIITGGTRPADHIHPVVIEVMREKGFDLTNKKPRKITPTDLEECEYVITMGCSADNVCPVAWSGENREWDLQDPHGVDLEKAREIRDEILRKVQALFDELERTYYSSS